MQEQKDMFGNFEEMTDDEIYGAIAGHNRNNREFKEQEVRYNKLVQAILNTVDEDTGIVIMERAELYWIRYKLAELNNREVEE